MKVFVRVAQHVGFAAAARDLRMSAPAVSKHVAALEARVGARLFDRTTRRVALTEAGGIYLEHCISCLQAFEDADASMGELAKEPRGLLRVTAPIDFSEALMPVVAEVMRAEPSIVIDLRLTNRVVDLVEEGVDVAVRIAPSLDGRYVARPLARTRLSVLGAPAYLDRHGRPRKPEDLAKHRALVFAEPKPMEEMVFIRGRREVRVKPTVVLTSNIGAVLLDGVLSGLGVGPFPSFTSHRELAAGRLEVVLPDWSLFDFRVFAVYPHRRFLSPKVKVLVEALRATFGDGTRDYWWPDT